MKNKIFIFAGNRFYVLQEMLKQDLPITRIYALKNSWLERSLLKREIKFETLPPQKEFIDQLQGLSFDYFVANGLPHILPVSRLCAGNNKKFINIHPSFLPDLRGADPQPGALLYGRDSGATCHYMNDAIDAGKIISRVFIPYSPQFDAGLLYALTFRAEKTVFREALRKKFTPMDESPTQSDGLYYTFHQKDLYIDFNAPDADIIRRIKAFNTPNKMARFVLAQQEWRVSNADFIRNDYLDETFSASQINEIVVNYGRNLLIKRGNGFLLFKGVIGPGDVLPEEGTLLCAAYKERPVAV